MKSDDDKINQAKADRARALEVIHGIEHEGWRSKSDTGAGWYDTTVAELTEARRRLSAAQKPLARC